MTRAIRTCLKAVSFGAFCSFFFDMRQHIGRKEETKTPRNLHALRSKILERADFSVKRGKNVVNPAGFTGVLTMDEQKSAFLKQGSNYSCHLMIAEREKNSSISNKEGRKCPRLRWNGVIIQRLLCLLIGVLSCDAQQCIYGRGAFLGAFAEKRNAIPNGWRFACIMVETSVLY